MWRRVAPVMIGWTAVALFFANRMFYSYQLLGPPVSWRDAIAWSLLDWYLWALLAPLVFRLYRPFPLGRGAPFRNLLVHLGLSVTFMAAHSALYGAALWLRWRSYENVSIDDLLASLFLARFHFDVLTYWGLVFLQMALDYHRRYREGEVRASRMEAQLARAELHALRMQLNPHFLFNTLNAISALMSRDVAAAERMLARLSDFLRLTLETGRSTEVPLRQELDFLRRYLEIEQVRFPDRLRVDMDVEPGTLEARVPSLILQPIVENAIRHGVAPSSEAGHIRIVAARRNGDLMLRVRDDGPGLAPGPSRVREGVGLSNTRERLRQLYGPSSVMTLTNAEGGGLDVTLSLPFRSAARIPTEMEGD
ncbi:MAG: histidine kinase [bacterium]